MRHEAPVLFRRACAVRTSILLLTLPLALAACGEEKKADPLAERDPAVTGALSDPIMADPDLTSQNRGDTALSGGGPATAEVPLDKRTPEEAEKARLDARDLLGGSIDPAPAATVTLPESRLAKAATPEAVAAALKLGPASCPAKVSYTFAWAARLPAALAIYPRGHARVAAGTDDAGCKLRSVRFATPVAVPDVVDYYYASARKAALAPERRKEGGDEVVAGANYAVYVRQGRDGMTEVDLVTSGF
jgi:hypothetical protein